MAEGDVVGLEAAGAKPFVSDSSMRGLPVNPAALFLFLPMATVSSHGGLC